MAASIPIGRQQLIGSGIRRPSLRRGASVERGDNHEKQNRASSLSPARSEHAWPIGVHYAGAAHIKFAFCCLFSSSTRRHGHCIWHTRHTALTERQAPTVGQAETQPRQRQRIATRVTLRTRQAEPAVPAVPVLPVLPAVTEELAATPPRPPPRAQPIALAMVSLPRLAQAAQAAQAAQRLNLRCRRLRRQCDLECNSDQRPQRVSLLHCQWRNWRSRCINCQWRQWRQRKRPSKRYRSRPGHDLCHRNRRSRRRRGWFCGWFWWRGW